MYSDFCHLLVQLYDHCPEPTWQGISTILCHLVHCIQSLHYAVGLELLTDNLVISLDRWRLGCNQLPTYRPAYFISDLTKERASGNIKINASMVIRTFCKCQHVGDLPAGCVYGALGPQHLWENSSISVLCSWSCRNRSLWKGWLFTSITSTILSPAPLHSYICLDKLELNRVTGSACNPLDWM